jgi:hypothetical protein
VGLFKLLLWPVIDNAEYLITEQNQFIEGKFQVQESMKFYHEWGAHHKVKPLANKYRCLLLLLLDNPQL